MKQINEKDIEQANVRCFRTGHSADVKVTKTKAGARINLGWGSRDVETVNELDEVLTKTLRSYVGL